MTQHKSILNNDMMTALIPDLSNLSKLFTDDVVTTCLLNYFTIDKIAECAVSVDEIDINMIYGLIRRGIHVLNSVAELYLRREVCNKTIDKYKMYVKSFVKCNNDTPSSLIYGEFVETYHKFNNDILTELPQIIKIKCGNVDVMKYIVNDMVCYRCKDDKITIKSNGEEFDNYYHVFSCCSDIWYHNNDIDNSEYLSNDMRVNRKKRIIIHTGDTCEIHVDRFTRCFDNMIRYKYTLLLTLTIPASYKGNVMYI